MVQSASHRRTGSSSIGNGKPARHGTVICPHPHKTKKRRPLSCHCQHKQMYRGKVWMVVPVNNHANFDTKRDEGEGRTKQHRLTIWLRSKQTSTSDWAHVVTVICDVIACATTKNSLSDGRATTKYRVHSSTHNTQRYAEGRLLNGETVRLVTGCIAALYTVQHTNQGSKAGREWQETVKSGRHRTEVSVEGTSLEQLSCFLLGARYQNT